MERSYRYRVNVSQTVKGVLTFEATVEAEGAPVGMMLVDGKESLDSIHDDVLRRSDVLVADLRRRYPPVPEPEPKGKP